MAIECHSCFQWLMPTVDYFRDHWPEVEIDIPSGHHFDPYQRWLVNSSTW